MNIEQSPEPTKKEQSEHNRNRKNLSKNRAIRIKRIKKNIPKFLILAAVVAIVVFGWNASKQESTNTTASTQEILQIRSDDWVKGNPEAELVIIEYIDFECGACAAYYPLTNRLYEEYGDRIAFVTRYFPLPFHKNGLPSALAVEAAGTQGKYWQMHDLLFDNQKTWGGQRVANPTIFEKYAEQLDLDMEMFRNDVLAKETKQRILKDRDDGLTLQVQGTPTFFINGKKIQNPKGYDAFVALIENALKK